MIINSSATVFKLLLIPITILFFSACGDDDDDDDPVVATATSNIVETAQSNSNLTTLVAAIEAAELATTLATTENITVFAPTNAAFDALPDGAVKDIVAKVAAGTELTSAEKTALTAVLTYHVVDGSAAVASSAVTANTTLESLNNDEKLFFVPDTSAGSLTVNGNASVDADLRDVTASNGIVHDIDQVLIPDAYLTVVGSLQKRYEHTTLVAAVVAADLVTTLNSSTGTFTVFAPTNAAFAALPEGAVADIVAKVGAGTALSSEEETALTGVLTYHVLASEVLAADVPDSAAVETASSGATIATTSASSASGVTVQGGSNTAAIAVSEADVDVSNGVIHVVGTVILP